MKFYNDQELRHYVKFNKKLIQFLEKQIEKLIVLEEEKPIEPIDEQALQGKKLADSLESNSTTNTEKILELSIERRALLRVDRTMTKVSVKEE